MGLHYVPQRYLKNFSSRPGLIWLFDQGGGAREVAIDSVAQERRFYDSEDEPRLDKEIERPGGDAIEQILEGHALTTPERNALARHVATMLMRVPSRRQRATEMVSAFLGRDDGKLRAEILKGAGLPGRLKALDEMSERYQGQKQVPANLRRFIRDPRPTEKVYHCINQMTWRIIVTKGPSGFITSDNPAVYFENDGLANETSELTFPLSPTHALHASHQGESGGFEFVRVKEEIVRRVNIHVASKSTKVIFYHESAPWVSHLATRKKREPGRLRLR